MEAFANGTRLRVQHSVWSLDVPFLLMLVAGCRSFKHFIQRPLPLPPSSYHGLIDVSYTTKVGPRQSHFSLRRHHWHHRLHQGAGPRRTREGRLVIDVKHFIHRSGEDCVIFLSRHGC